MSSSSACAVGNFVPSDLGSMKPASTAKILLPPIDTNSDKLGLEVSDDHEAPRSQLQLLTTPRPRPVLSGSPVAWRRMADMMECKIVWHPLIGAAIKQSIETQLQLILRRLNSAVKSLFLFWFSFRISRGLNVQLETTKKAA
jgi:hypothetical protein